MPTSAISQRGTNTKYYLTAVNGSVKLEPKAGEHFGENQLWSKESGSGDRSFRLVSASKRGDRVLVTADKSKPGDFVPLETRPKSKTAKKEELWTESKVEGVKTAKNESYLYIHKPGDSTLVLDSGPDKSVVLSINERGGSNPKPSQCWEYIDPSESEGNAAKGVGSGASSMPGNGEGSSSGDRSSKDEYPPTAATAAQVSAQPKKDTRKENDRKRRQQ